MRLHYQRANPDVGGESILLRFEGIIENRTICFLVNSGRGVHIDTLLDESRGDYFGGIIINNAHPEYYCTLGENVREDTPIYAAPDTATILSEALTEPDARTVDGRSVVLEQLVSIDEWFQIAPGLQVHPVSSGHAPGTAGFLFEITDESEGESEDVDGNTERGDFHTLFVTDEFTIRRAAGYPGLDLELPVEVDALLLSGAVDTTATTDTTAASNTEFTPTPTFTETLSIVCERARNDSTVLVTADEPTGIHAAYLLGHLGKRLGSPFPITVAGRIATLCERLGYSIPNVTLLPEGTPEKILTPGTVAIAAPNGPVQGVSGRLFETLADDPDAAVIRLTRGVATPMSAARCMMQSFPWHNYPDPESLNAVIETLAPVQVVLADRELDFPAGDFEYDSFVWVIDDDLVYTLYDGTRWIAPAETDPDIEQRIRQRVTDRRGEPSPSAYERSLSLPKRRNGIDFAAEGLDIDMIHDRLLPSGSSDTSWRRSDSEEKRPVTQFDADDGSYTEATTITPSATDGGTTSFGASLTTLREQIDDIESSVEERQYQASVIDAGDDVCLFRVQNPSASFEHGQDVTLVLDTTNNTHETETDTDTSNRENGSDTTTTDTGLDTDRQTNNNK